MGDQLHRRDRRTLIEWEMLQPPAVRFENVSRHFGEVKAVDDLNLDILDGEFFTMLGPSGSGKTTCLRMIAGFERPTSGQIWLHGRGCLQPAAIRA